MKSAVDLTSRVGTVVLPNPIMTASGTAGHGAELSAYFDLSVLGAVVVKSLSAEAWAGNPAPRVHETEAGMLNSVGLQNPGVEAWLADELPALVATGARVVASIWGTTVAGYEKAAAVLAASAPAAAALVAVEVNLSCPNLEGGRHMFSSDPSATREAVAAVVGVLDGRPAWAKLSPNVTDIVEIAVAARDGGAAALTLVNTVKGMAIDPVSRRPRLGTGGGGLSGAGIRPVAVRAIFDVHAALPHVPIVGVGGVASGEHAVELLLAGASAVQVGTATFDDPRACVRVLAGLEAWCRRHRVARVADLVGQAHGAP
ncbi:MAG: dihydroorotate dehydrogenase catalytic subunit [Actinomycetota bacterium]|nr:dihydroorotate dehydrogenase catalytic subunit [Actinomycetota bacterium]